MSKIKRIGLVVAFVVVMISVLGAGMACLEPTQDRTSDHHELKVKRGSGPGSLKSEGKTKEMPLKDKDKMLGMLPVVLPIIGGIVEESIGLMTSGENGIWVTGEGTLTIEPDLAMLHIGVESSSDTVAEASTTASKSMDAIFAVLKSHDLADTDMQTLSFNIFPTYEWDDRARKRKLIGYSVSNTAAIKIRDLENIGKIIDEIAGAGGDETRIDGIRFTVEDTSGLKDRLRELAVIDALAKANHLASLSGVSLGKLVFMDVRRDNFRSDEYGGYMGDIAFERAIVGPVTPIVGGELEMKLTVEAKFRIR